MIKTKKYEIQINIERCEGVYPPSEDTLLLIEALDEKDIISKEVLEIGTGTGIIAILCAKIGAEKVTATDVKQRAVECAKKNAELNEVKIRVLLGNLFEPIGKEKFDTVIFNPPYLPEDPIYDKYLKDEDKIDLIGGKKGIETTLNFIDELPKHLKKHGKAYIVASSLSVIEDITQRAKEKELLINKIKTAEYGNEKIIIFRLTKTKQ